MPNLDVLKRHAALVDRMAISLGIDLEEKALRAEVSMDDLSELVFQCARCSNPDHCDQRMQVERSADHPPGYCRNSDVLMALKP